MKGTPFTHDELEFVQANYGKMKARAIAAKLGRTKTAIHQCANRYGWSKPMADCLSNDQIIAAINLWHPQGLTDPEITDRLFEQHGIKTYRNRVGALRHALGLPSNVHSDRQRQRIRETTRGQLQKAGLSSLGELRAKMFDDVKVAHGWPTDLSIRAVQALDLFYRLGPLTRVQLCKLMGVDPSIPTNPKSNAKGGTVLAELVRAGMIARLPKAVKVERDIVPGDKRPALKKKNIDLYFLEPGVKPNEQAKSCAQAC